jgi:hypothetical protein
MMAIPDDMIGAIKIKDGIFIGDEFAAQVSIIHMDSSISNPVQFV